MDNKKFDWDKTVTLVLLVTTTIVMTIVGVVLDMGFFEPYQAMLQSFIWTGMGIGFLGACFCAIVYCLYLTIKTSFSFLKNCFKYGLPNSRARTLKIDSDLTNQHYWWPALRDRLTEELIAEKNAPPSSVRGTIGDKITKNMIAERLLATEEERLALANYIKTKMDEKHITASECYTSANLTRQTFWKIMRAKTESPKTGTLIAIAMALKLSLDETKEMLAIVGRWLSRFNKAEIIAELFLEKGYYDVDELDLAINKFGGNIHHLEEMR